MPMPTASRSSARSDARLAARNARLRSGVGVSRYGRLRRMSAYGPGGGRSSAGARGASFVATDQSMLLPHLPGKGRFALGRERVERRRLPAASDQGERDDERATAAGIEQVGV